MRFSEYCEYVKNAGHFEVHLNDHRGQPGITDEACNLVVEKWLTPLLGLCEAAYIYRRIYKDRSYDSTPPPGSPKPPLISKTTVRIQLDPKTMVDKRYHHYWAWALKHANITLCFSKGIFPIAEVQKECWDPSILMNLGAVVALGAIQLAKREALKDNVCCLFSSDSYSISCSIFAPTRKLLAYYKRFVVNCRFILKGLERELGKIRNAE